MPPTRAPDPSRTFFDPFNSSSTGHQRGENRVSGSTSWRNSRAHKLALQFHDISGGGGDTHHPDLVGAGSVSFGEDGRKENGSWGAGASGLREGGWQDIRYLMGVNRKRKSEAKAENLGGGCKRTKADFKHETDAPATHNNSILIGSQAPPHPQPQASGPRASPLPETSSKPIPTTPQIFQSLTLYLNGSTHGSGVSDHRLKSLFVQHGGSLSINLGRRTVTHVVLGSSGCGLAAGKIQKEVIKVGGKGVKYVTASWVVDSVKCGKRLPESGYKAVHTAMRGQGSVLGKLGGTQQLQGEDGKESSIKSFEKYGT